MSDLSGSDLPGELIPGGTTMADPEIRLVGRRGSKSGWIMGLDPDSFSVSDRPDGSLLLQGPPTVFPHRIIGQSLPRNPDGSYTLPQGYRNLEIWVNGLHYWEETDFKVVGLDLRPILGAGNWPADADVRVNCDT